MKKVLVCLVLLAAVSFGTRSYAYYEYKGYISGDANLLTSNDWSSYGAMLSWIVSFDDSTRFWTYYYTFTIDEEGKPGISHVITEVSGTFDENNIKKGTSEYDELDTFSSSNPSNSGLIGDLYGLKFEGNGGTSYSWTIISDRRPMWGDFYAKGGSDNGNNDKNGKSSPFGYAYNSGIGNTTDKLISESNDNSFGWVLVPDTVTMTVPEPETLVLLGLGILFIVFVLKKIRNRKNSAKQNEKK